MRRAAFLVFLVGCFCFLGNAAGAADKRVALVIGNSAYVNAGALRNPRNDATDVAAKLRALGFDVAEGLDLDKRSMEVYIRDFGNAIEDADVALFYYAGHGMLVRGKNHLAPVDARFKSETDIDFETIDFDLVLRQMERSTRINLVFLDACRDNPLAQNAAQMRGANIMRGLGRVERTLGTLIAFATEPGSVAADGDGRNSPFTRALLAHMATPGQSVSDMMIEVRNEVLRETNKRQVPWDNSSLTGRFFFSPPVEKPVEAAKPSDDLLALREDLKKLQLEQTARLEAQQHELEALRQKFAPQPPEPAVKPPEPEAAAVAPERPEQLEAPPGDGEADPPQADEATAGASSDPVEVAPAVAAVAPEADTDSPEVAAAAPEADASEAAPDAGKDQAAASQDAASKPAGEAEAAPADAKNGAALAVPVEPAKEEVAVAAVAAPAEEEQPEDSAEPEEAAPTREALIREIQADLHAIGCYTGKIDGKWGDLARASVDRFSDLSSLAFDNREPSGEIAEAVSGWKGAHCQIEAAPDAEEAAPEPQEAAPQPRHKAAPRKAAPRRAAPRLAPKAAPIERARKRERVHQRIERARPAYKARPPRQHRSRVVRQHRQHQQSRRARAPVARGRTGGFAGDELRRTFPNQAWPD